MKKQLLTGALLLATLFTAQAQITITLADADGNPLSFEGGFFNQISEAGDLTGTLTSIDFDVVLQDSTDETYASDIAVLVTTGLTADDDLALQAGGYTDFGFTEHIEFIEGGSEEIGTALVETLTPETPITLTDSEYQLWVGNGYGGDGNIGAWSGTITFNGVSVASVKNILASSINVFPNPANDVVSVTNTSSALIKGIQIADLNGRTVKSVSYTGLSNAQVNVSDLSSGIYMMTISSDRGTITKKVVKN